LNIEYNKINFIKLNNNKIKFKLFGIDPNFYDVPLFWDRDWLIYDRFTVLQRFILVIKKKNENS
jgi:hypothetical protein